MSYHCPECKLLFSALPHTCPRCGGAVHSDTRLDRYYLADGFARHTGDERQKAATAAAQPEANTVSTPKPTVSPKTPKPSTTKAADTTPKESKTAPKAQIQDGDILSSLRESYYSQHGKPAADTEKHTPVEPATTPSPADKPKESKTSTPAAAKAACTEKKATPKKTAAEQKIPAAGNAETTKKKAAPTPPSADGGFFSNPGPAPHIPEEAAAFEPLPTVEPIPTIEPEPISRRGMGGYRTRATLANVPWRFLFRLLLLLLLIGAIAALIVNLPTILSAAANVAVSLLPSILLVGGMLWLLRCLFRGGK